MRHVNVHEMDALGFLRLGNLVGSGLEKKTRATTQTAAGGEFVRIVRIVDLRISGGITVGSLVAGTAVVITTIVLIVDCVSAVVRIGVIIVIDKFANLCGDRLIEPCCDVVQRSEETIVIVSFARRRRVQ